MNRSSLSLVAGIALLLPSSLFAGPKAVFLIGEREYDTNITLPAFARAELVPRGYDCVFVQATSDEDEGRNEFPGIEAIDTADILIVSTRRRTLRTEDLARVRKHLKAGKPLVAIRTACHGFALRTGEPEEGYAVWPNFDQEILGIRYDNHLANDAASTYLPVTPEHPVMKGVGEKPIPSDGSLYRMFDLDPKATLLLNGTTTIKDEQFTFPAAWLRTTADGSRIFGSSIGHKSDFEKPAIRQLLVNACAWCLDNEELAAAASPAERAATYGFAPVEVFELDWRTFGLQSSDFNNDGLLDLAAADNRKSRIALFLQKANPSSPQADERTNAIVDPGRFEQSSVLVDRALTAIASGDINGDGLTDLITLEKPERLVVRLQTPSGFEESQTLRIPDAGTGPFDLDVADLDADGDADVVVLGDTETSLFESKGSTGLVALKARLNTSNDLNMLQLVDVDGDGRMDWFYSANDPAGAYLCVRQQLEEPLAFGPEIRLSKDEYRAIAIGEVNGQAGTELVAIDKQTGRLEVLQYGLTDESAAGLLSERVVQFGLTGGKQDRVSTVGDFNGDGKLDLAVNNPKSAELILFLQNDDGLETATLCPSLVGVTSLAASDFNADGRDEILVLSQDESSVGVATWNPEKQTLDFPEVLPMAEGISPIDACVPEVVAKDQHGFVLLQQRTDGSKKLVEFATWTLADGQWKQANTIEPPGDADPTSNGLLQLDANNDGRTDFLHLTRRQGSVAYLSDDDGKVTVASGGLALPRLARVNVTTTTDGNALLVTQERYVRRMSYANDNGWQVLEQVNALGSGVSFEAAVELPSANAPAAVCAYDRQGGRLYLFTGTTTPQTVDVGQFQLQQMLAGDFDNDGRADVALIGGDRVGIVLSHGQGPTLKPQITFESDDERAYLADVVVGDINNDGQSDLIVNETRQHTVAVVAPLWITGRAEQAIRFKLFEEKSFSSEREQPGLQPREMIIADVTGDGRNDLIMLCHDRLLVHPQDGPAE